MIVKKALRLGQTTLGAASLGMVAVGVYYDAVNATPVFEGPFGLSILSLGAAFMGLSAALLIVQLRRRIQAFEESYQYGLWLEELILTPTNDNLQLSMKLTNSLEAPIEYKLNTSNFHLEVAGNTPNHMAFDTDGNIVPSKRYDVLLCRGAAPPLQLPCEGHLTYELLYGPPGRLRYRQTVEKQLTLRQSPQGMVLISKDTRREFAKLHREELQGSVRDNLLQQA
ncbi:MAG: hypothetical protein HY532_04860 [Chloroflexi bacterium]|nr:hypothetical protein [Chloroflexota bacterium]